ncbi:hypothetical protein GQ43DRAFT_466858 [Delitschia confertaspora ATCC 74209]|uniref:Uncharacterized protein n=1 Tax=Delitschia confertaspora ATCC 74209 TaxID=1513339 RepID=A0A9P4JEK4_9PLEO|nr:hypothetical protein GQ43DRAFT_466858 [Delitschia confertaspora ATCC 74209]
MSSPTTTPSSTTTENPLVIPWTPKNPTSNAANALITAFVLAVAFLTLMYIALIAVVAWGRIRGNCESCIRLEAKIKRMEEGLQLGQPEHSTSGGNSSGGNSGAGFRPTSKYMMSGGLGNTGACQRNTQLFDLPGAVAEEGRVGTGLQKLPQWPARARKKLWRRNNLREEPRETLRSSRGGDGRSVISNKADKFLDVDLRNTDQTEMVEWGDLSGNCGSSPTSTSRSNPTSWRHPDSPESHMRWMPGISDRPQELVFGVADDADRSQIISFSS